MKGINVNFGSKRIEMTKSFAHGAGQYGSDEYKALVEIRKEFPDYKLVVKTPAKKSTPTFRGMTYENMEKYILAHEPSLLPEFYTLTGKAENGNEFTESAYYGEIKQWFITGFRI